MHVLVAIANYGPFRFGYLDKALHAYRRMPFEVDVVLHTDRPKRLPAGVRAVVGLPSPDPHSLPFAHKPLFAEQVENYDLFVYSEDDILIEERHVAAFLTATELLPGDEVAGLFRFEVTVGGGLWYPDAHPPFDWVPRSVRRHGALTFAGFSNDHAGCYLLTRAQLRRAVASGGYLVEPYCWRYDMRETAATDPYTRCGLTRRLCVSHLEHFAVHHLPNNYAGRLGMPHEAFRERLERFLAVEGGGGA